MSEQLRQVRLWCPLASRADVVIGDRHVPMVADGAEHWTIDLPVRTEYLLSVDGDRSTWQPHGVHGVSEYIGSDRDRPGEKPTVARPRCNGSWTPRMARGWRSASTWSTTASARPATTPRSSRPTPPAVTPRHGGDAINLDDEHSAGVRYSNCDNALRWLQQFHINALRLDPVHALVDESAKHILAELSERVDALRGALDRPLSLIAEPDMNQWRMVLPGDEGGLGISSTPAQRPFRCPRLGLASQPSGA